MDPVLKIGGRGEGGEGGEGASPKTFFSALWVSVRSKNKGGRSPGFATEKENSGGS